MSTNFPTWLPDPIPFNGDWNAFVRTLYAVFESDFKHGRPRFRGCPIWHNQRIDSDGPYRFEEGFWHLVTRDQWVFDYRTRRKVKDRLPELERASLVPWARPILDHESNPSVTVFEFEDETRKGVVVRTYLWLHDWDYVVILEKQAKTKGEVYMLVTSFLVDIPAKRKDLQSRYDRRLK
ncbi:MAG: hypothetical protein AB7I98_05525 [Verrucomicrobiales bacterium]